MTSDIIAYLAPDGRATVIDAAAGDDGWGRGLAAEQPTMRLARLGRGESLDRFCQAHGIRHVNYLRIGDPTASLPMLFGAQRLLRHARIDVVEIASDPAVEPSSAAVAMIAAVTQLQRAGFAIMAPGPLVDHVRLRPRGGEPRPPVLLALHQRFQRHLDQGGDPVLAELMVAHGLTPRGVIHVGAHLGEEVPAYLASGFAPVLLIEPLPAAAAALAERYGADTRVSIAACAATAFDGTVELRVTNYSPSTSILALKDHAALYPEVTETRRVRVPARTLDSLLAERADPPGTFNIAIVDVQGAELMVLRGAAGLLSSLDGLLIEVNFAELYEGCAQIEDVDGHLSGFGFVRVMTTSPHQSAYGDAFYIKPASAARRD